MKASVGHVRSLVRGLLAPAGGGDDDSLATRLRLIRWLVPARLVVGLSLTSIGGAVCEAGTLLMIIRSATAVAAGEDEVDLSSGPLQFDGVPVDYLLLAAAGLALTRLTLHLVTSYLAARASSQVLIRLRGALVGAFLSASWEVQSAERQGQLQNLATSHVLQASRAALFVALAVTAAINFGVMVVSALVVSLLAAGLMAVGVALLYVVFRPLTRLGRVKAKQFAEANSEYAVAVSEGAGLALESTTFGVERQVGERLTARAATSARRLFQVQLVSRSLSGLYQNVAILFLTAGIWAIAGQGEADLSTLGAVVVILLRALSYSQSFQVAQHQVNELLPFAAEVARQVDAYESAERRSGSRPLPVLESFAFDSVGYGYDDADAVLSDLTFDVRAGEAIGVVGPSGAGKSTLAQILLRLRLPATGTYTVNGVDAEEFALADWQARVSFVPQEPHILQGTVGENVRFFRDLDDETVERACRAAHIHEEILDWSDGYRTELGSGSNLLSGGQRQRLCIARALAGDPDLLVLDEPTSALDMRSEAAFQETLAELRGRVTLLIIAHRVPTLRLCDRVIVMRSGRVEAFEEPEELARTNTFFAEALRLSRV